MSDQSVPRRLSSGRNGRRNDVRNDADVQRTTLEPDVWNDSVCTRSDPWDCQSGPPRNGQGWLTWGSMGRHIYGIHGTAVYTNLWNSILPCPTGRTRSCKTTSVDSRTHDDTDPGQQDTDRCKRNCIQATRKWIGTPFSVQSIKEPCNKGGVLPKRVGVGS